MEHKGNNNADNGNTNNSNTDSTQRDTNDNNTRDFYISQSEPPGPSLPVSSPPSSSTPLVTSPFHEQSLAAPVTTSSPTSSTNMSNVSPPNPSTNNNSNNNNTTTTPATPAATHKTQAAFVNKLYTMVEDQSIQHLISWAPTGDVFSVSNPTEFSKSVLPQYFKHNNWQSFVRQLNMYGFHKVNDMFHANPSSESQAWEFKHPDFRRGQLLALQNIKRKSSKPSTPSSLKGNMGSTGTGQSPMTDIDMRDDRIECLTNQMSEMMDKMRQMHENYGLLYAETVSCRMLQSKHQQVITTITSLLTSMSREDDSNDPRSLKRKFEMDLLTAEVAKLGQSDMQPPSHSPMMQHPSTHYHREHPTRSMSTPQPMVGLEPTPMQHSQITDDFRAQPYPSGSGYRQQKVQTSSPLAMLPEIPFSSFPSNNYLRHRSPEPISGVSPSNSRSASLDTTYSRSVSISQSSTHTSSSQYSQTNSHSSHMTSSLPSPPIRRSSQPQPQPQSTYSFGSDSNLLNPSENNRYKDNNSSITQSQSQHQRPPSLSSTSPTPFKSENPVVNNPSTSQTRAPPLPDPPDINDVKRRKKN